MSPDGVLDAMARFADAVDTKDWVALRDCFTDQIDFDYSSYRAGSQGTVSADDWVARSSRRFESLDATQHQLTGPRVTIAESRATCTMQVRAWHVVRQAERDRECTIVGRYSNDLVLIGDVWRISALRLQVRWIGGERSILDL